MATHRHWTTERDEAERRPGEEAFLAYAREHGWTVSKGMPDEGYACEPDWGAELVGLVEALRVDARMGGLHGTPGYDAWRRALHMLGETPPEDDLDQTRACWQALRNEIYQVARRVRAGGKVDGLGRATRGGPMCEQALVALVEEMAKERGLGRHHASWDGDFLRVQFPAHDGKDDRVICVSRDDFKDGTGFERLGRAMDRCAEQPVVHDEAATVTPEYVKQVSGGWKVNDRPARRLRLATGEEIMAAMTRAEQTPSALPPDPTVSLQKALDEIAAEEEALCRYPAGMLSQARMSAQTQSIAAEVASAANALRKAEGKGPVMVTADFNVGCLVVSDDDGNRLAVIHEEPIADGVWREVLESHLRGKP